MINWKPIESLKITPQIENYSFLLYVRQDKLCRRSIPQVITADIIDGELEISPEYDFCESDWNLCGITHYAEWNDPYDDVDEFKQEFVCDGFIDPPKKVIDAINKRFWDLK